MSTLLAQLLTPPRSSSKSALAPARRLRETTAAVRISFTWFGTRKTLSPEQNAEAAETFGAEGNYLSAAKKLLDTKHRAFRAVTSVRHRILSDWKQSSLPFPEPGIRLIRQDEVEPFQQRMTAHQTDLAAAIGDLDLHYADLQELARQRLGRLYQPADYPASLIGLFDVSCDFPSVEPPPYLQRLSPALYRQESARVAARFDEAVGLAEEAFLAELERFLGHLTERLSGLEDGKPKVFRDSAVDNLSEFFERFRRLNIRSNAQLDDLVDQLRQIVRGVDPQSLRRNQPLRQRVAAQLAEVHTVVDGLVVERPRRNILRRPR